MLTVTKVFPSVPFAHRAPHHDGHCRLVHGHNWTFSLTFAADTLDGNGFIVDFGKLKGLRQHFDKLLDHALVVNSGDPELPKLQALDEAGLCRLVAVPDCSCEGLAELVWTHSTTWCAEAFNGRVRVVSATVHEDEKNSATFSL